MIIFFRQKALRPRRQVAGTEPGRQRGEPGLGAILERVCWQRRCAAASVRGAASPIPILSPLGDMCCFCWLAEHSLLIWLALIAAYENSFGRTDGQLPRPWAVGSSRTGEGGRVAAAAYIRRC